MTLSKESGQNLPQSEQIVQDFEDQIYKVEKGSDEFEAFKDYTNRFNLEIRYLHDPQYGTVENRDLVDRMYVDIAAKAKASQAYADGHADSMIFRLKYQNALREENSSLDRKAVDYKIAKELMRIKNNALQGKSNPSEAPSAK